MSASSKSDESASDNDLAMAVALKINKTTNLVFYQAHHIEPRTSAYIIHAIQADIGGKKIFNTPVVLTCLKLYNYVWNEPNS